MSNFDFPDPQQQDYANSFNAPTPQKKSGGGSRAALLVIGCAGGGVVLCCVCCVLLFFTALRQPIGAAGFWGVAIQAGSYDLAYDVVCDGSQAEQYTQSLENQNATFTSFEFSQTTTSTGVGDIQLSGVIERNGQSSDWSASVTTQSDGNLLGNCVNTITEN